MKIYLLLLLILSASTYSFGQCAADFTTNTNGSTVTFTNTSTGTNLGYTWSFGDGNYSSQTNPSHTYTTSGLYAVCLSVYDMDSLSPNPCQDTYCDSVYISVSSSCDASASINVTPNGTIEANATSPLAYGYYWSVFNSMGNQVYSYTSNPLSYNPGVPGNYTVCLTTYDSLQFLCDSTCYSVLVPFDSTGNTGCDASATIWTDSMGTIYGTATSSGATEFYWSVFDANGNFLTDASTNPMSYNPGMPGVYTVCLTTYDSLQFLCDSTCYLVATDSTAGFAELEMETLHVFPNPANDRITVTATGQVLEIVLIDITGSTVRRVDNATTTTVIDIEALPQGMYFVHALGREGQQLSSRKIIKR